jgi:hypothetical protein
MCYQFFSDPSLIVAKLFKICREYVDPVLGDELKIKRNVLLRRYPTLCDDIDFLDQVPLIEM